MANEPQNLPKRHNAPKIEFCSTLSLSKGLPCVAFCEAGSSTSVENPLQISSFMQNKPNFQKSQMNVTLYNTTDYENISDWTIGESKPNSKPTKPNLQDTQMSVNSILTKVYIKYDDFAVRKNKPNSNPISSKAKNERKRFFTKGL